MRQPLGINHGRIETIPQSLENARTQEPLLQETRRGETDAIAGRFDSANALKEARTELEESEARTRHFHVAQMKPAQTPEMLATLRNLERSSRAETKLRKRALVYLSKHGRT